MDPISRPTKRLSRCPMPHSSSRRPPSFAALIAAFALQPFVLAVALQSTPVQLKDHRPKGGFKAGAAAVSITPFGQNPDWDGTVTESGVWGEKFSDQNHNGRWDPGE